MKKRESISVTVDRVWGTGIKGTPWCVVETHHYKAPKWMFWKHYPDTCKIFGPFPSRNQAEKFATRLSHPL